MKIRAIISRFFSLKNSPWFIIGVGIILRVAQFFYNRSLTEGEAALALNIVGRTYIELLKPLNYVQAAPVGFLMIQRFFVELFGSGEYAMRIFPLIAGIVSLLLLYEVARKILNKGAMTIALILFAVCNHVIYFSSEVKQYSSDVTLTLLIILITLYVLNSNFNLKSIILFGITSALSIWLSHPALFTLIGAVTVLITVIIKKKNWRLLVGLCFAGIITLTSLTFNYLLSLRALSRHRELLEFWQPSFMPFPPRSLADIRWFGYVFLRTFKFPVGLSIYELLLAVLSFATGCLYMFLKKRKIFFILLLPILLALIGSGLHKYPFEGRLLLFITPSMILIIAEGINYMRMKMAYASPILGFALVFILIAYPVGLAAYHLIKPRAPEELRPVMEYIGEQYEQKDVIYVYYASANAYRYYAPRFEYTDDYIIGIEARSNWVDYYHDLEQLKGNKRVWIMLSHIATKYGVDEEELFVSYLNILGRQLDAFKVSGASAYLYNMAD
jgi:uncharacterized membrane protein